MSDGENKSGKNVVFSEQTHLFSVAFHLIQVDKPLDYDLYVNFSPDGKSNKFIKVFPQKQSMDLTDLSRIKVKHSRVYILEEQRDLYLKSLASLDTADKVEKSTIIKESAIKYLDDIFDKKRSFTTQVLNESVERCHSAVESMVQVIQGFSIDQLQDHIAKLSFHDFYTYDHSINVSMYCISFYRHLYPNAPESEVVMAGLGGMLHDLGKVKISTSIINNPGKLSAEELVEMKKHPNYGKALMQQRDFKSPPGMDLGILQRVVNEHHENWDGSGYPNGLKGDAIHVLARMTSICDFFDAITTKRSYSKPLSVNDALGIMLKTAGQKIDPTLFDSFCTQVKGYKGVVRPVAELDPNFDPCMPHTHLPLKGIRIN
jgi:HD-GYP domain-containing protein (c-di-GMP phosphodiesterase class II)